MTNRCCDQGGDKVLLRLAPRQHRFTSSALLRAARRLRPTRLNGKAALHAPRHRPHAIRHPPAQVARPIDRAAHDGAGPSEHAAHGGGAAWGETIATVSTYHGR